MNQEKQPQTKGELSASVGDTIDDEVLRTRIREIIDHPNSDPSWKKISSNPLVALILGFLLTGIVGALLTNYYNRKQKELEFELSNKQLEREREKDERQKGLDFERNKQERAREIEHDDRQKQLEDDRSLQQKALERERDVRERNLEFRRSVYQKELERERSFADELNKTRVGKISEVWEKIYVYEATAEAAADEVAEVFAEPQMEIPSLSSGPEALRILNEKLEEIGRRNKVILEPSRVLKIELEGVLNRNRFWLGEDNYLEIKKYVDVTQEYLLVRSLISIDGDEASLKEVAERRERLRRSITQIRNRLIRE